MRNASKTLFKLLRWGCLIALLMALSGYIYFKIQADRLWQIVQQECLNHQSPDLGKNNQNRCLNRSALAESILSDNPLEFVLFKDRKGLYHQLIIPVVEVSGIEDTQLLLPETPNYFLLGWQQRAELKNQDGRPLPDYALSLAINSQYGRTQDQLHIHLSCIKPEIYQRIKQQSSKFNSHWQPLDGDIAGHRYFVRTISTQQLAEKSPFLWLSRWSQAKDNMGRYGLAMLPLPNAAGDELLLLATERNLIDLNLASAGEIQDYDCNLVNQ